METRPTPCVSQFWGQYSDLYHTLDAPEVELLEKAVFARRLGRFEEAGDIHDNRLPQARLVPVLALEKANLAARLCLAGDQYDILREALASSAEWRQSGSHRETALLEIAMAEAKLDWTGGIKVGLHEARTLRDQWAWPDLEMWTDVEVAFTIKYFTIMRSCRLHSNWVELDTDAMFLAAEKAEPWSGLESIIRLAKTHGKLFTCIDMIKLYTGLVQDNDEKLRVCSTIVKECEAGAVSKSRQSSLVLVYSRLWFADMLQELSEVQKASDELGKALNELSALTWILKEDTPNLLLEKLLLPSRNLHHFALAVQLSKLATVAHSSKDRLLETLLLTQAMGSLNEISFSRRHQTWYGLNERLLARNSELHANHQGRAVLTASKIRNLANTLEGLDDLSKPREYLQELIKFQELYPRFDVPTTLRSIYRGAAVALKRLGYSGEARAFDEKTVLALRDCPIDPSQFYRKYRDKPSSEWSPYLLDIIIPWIKADLVTAVLSAEQVTLMLNITVSGSNSEMTLDPDQVLAALELPGEAFVGKIFGSPIPVSCEMWESRLEQFERWLWDSPSNVDRYIRHTVLGDLQEARYASVQQHVFRVTTKSADRLNKDLPKLTIEDLAKVIDEDLLHDVHVMKSKERTRLVGLRSRLYRKAMSTSEDEEFSNQWALMCQRSQLATSVKALRTGLIQDHYLAEAQTWFEEAYSQMNNKDLGQRLATLQQISSFQVQRYILFGTVAPDASLETYDLYDQVYAEQRIARSILRGVESVTARTEIVAREGFMNHYDFAMASCIEAIGGGQRRNNYHRHFRQDLHYIPTAAPLSSRSTKTLLTNLIDWAQKKKARSVTEALGAEVILPRNVLSEASTNNEAVILLRREAEVQSEMNNADGDVLELSRALDLVRQEMRLCPSLEKLMSLRDGRALTESEIQSLSADLGENVVIVDFVYLPTSCTGLPCEIIPMVYKKGRLVSALFVTHELRLARIKAWVDAYLDQKEPLLEDESALNYLYPLIEAGVKFSNPGDPVVLCPTDALFNIPLHSIELPDGMPWIERNPIIYTQALSVLRLCQYTSSASEGITSTNTLAVQALSSDDLALPGAADMAFASRSNARLLQDEALTKESFLAACAESKLINFYGHAHFDASRPLDQYLAIRSLEAERVTVRDLFDLRLRPATHVNLVGCRSGRSEVGINDDQLGLSTALFAAGAASMVTTLWSIDMADGAAFQEAFFDELLAQSAQCESGIPQEDVHAPGNGCRRSFLDLAEALQAAVLRISVDGTGRRKAPYHWAAFTLQGCWNKFPPLNMKGIAKGE